MDVRWLCVVVCGLAAGCQVLSFSREGRPCDADGLCLPGYVCVQRTNTCVLLGSATACEASAEIACNGIDEDCDGTDFLERGTLQNCAGCNDPCAAANVMGSACNPKGAGFACEVTLCAPGFGDADHDAQNGCEQPCANVDADTDCDDVDTCNDVDRDGLGNGSMGNAGCATLRTDPDDANPRVCGAGTDDACDDCASGRYDPSADGPDLDGDGICDESDLDQDGDGLIPGGGDSNDRDRFVCRDADGDFCDDCAATGMDAPENDGLDTDGDGRCNVGDSDDDGDASPDNEDEHPLDSALCNDSDGDGCDDCALDHRDRPWHDGVDVDRDGLCAVGDCDDGIPTCKTNCGNKVACTEAFCLSSYPGTSAKPNPVCRLVSTAQELQNLLAAPPANATIGIVLQEDIALLGPLDLTNATHNYLLHQRAGKKLVFSGQGGIVISDHTHQVLGLTITSSNGQLENAIEIAGGGDNVIAYNTLLGFRKRGVYVHQGGDDIIANNVIAGATEAFSTSGDPSGGIVLVESPAQVGQALHVLANTVDLQDQPAIFISGCGWEVNLHQNTLRTTGASTSPLVFGDNASTQMCSVCMKQNVLVNAQDGPQFAVVQRTDNAHLSWRSGCSARNLVSGAFSCSCAGCSECLPSGFKSALGFDAADLGAAIDSSGAGLLCMDDPQLVDRAAFFAVLGVDLTGPFLDTVDFAGAAPEPGAREAHTPWCP